LAFRIGITDDNPRMALRLSVDEERQGLAGYPVGSSVHQHQPSRGDRLGKSLGQLTEH
jgi:hypothetical protein